MHPNGTVQLLLLEVTTFLRSSLMLSHHSRYSYIYGECVFSFFLHPFDCARQTEYRTLSRPCWFSEHPNSMVC